MIDVGDAIIMCSSPFPEPSCLHDPVPELPLRLRLLQHPILHPHRTPERTRPEPRGICGSDCLHGRRPEHHLDRIWPVHFQTRSIRRSFVVRVRHLDGRRGPVLPVHPVAADLGHGYLLACRGCRSRLLLPAK